jgi:cytochrome c2
VRTAVEKVDATKVADVPEGLQQIWIPALDRVDRCTTCHATIDWGESMAKADNPAKSHPVLEDFPELMEKHPIEEFGCTLCHGGQGSATTKDAAHGEVPFWEEPLLTQALAERYGVERRHLMEMRCNVCHQHQGAVKGMELLNEAKLRVAGWEGAEGDHGPGVAIIRPCISCHIVGGAGEKSTGPDLTRAGEKHPSQFHFPDDWASERTALGWHVQHLLDPESTSPGSLMKKYGLTDRQATGLALLVLSWREVGLLPRWIPAPRPALPKPRIWPPPRKPR